jgi:hypothetical protein
VEARFNLNLLLRGFQFNNNIVSFACSKLESIEVGILPDRLYMFVIIWLLVHNMVWNLILPVDSCTSVIRLLRRRINIFYIVFVVVIYSRIYNLIILVLMLFQFYVQQFLSMLFQTIYFREENFQILSIDTVDVIVGVLWGQDVDHLHEHLVIWICHLALNCLDFHYTLSWN